MRKWNICPAQSASRSFKLHLVICDLKGLSLDGLPKKENTNLIVQIEWRGPRKGYLSRRVVERNYTSKQWISSDGTVNWNEGFERDCKLKLMDSQNFRSWAINLEVHELGLESNSSTSTLAEFRVNIAEFACPAKSSQRTLRIPCKCRIGGSTIEARLTVTLELSEFQTKGRNSTVHHNSQTLLIPSLSSCIRFQHRTHSNRFQDLKELPEMGNTTHWRFSPNQSTNSSTSKSDEESEFSYRNLAAANFLIGCVSGKLEYSMDEKWDQCQPPNYQIARQPSLIRLLDWNKRILSFGATDHPRDKPLLNKAYGEDGGDDIDNDRRHQLIHTQPKQVQRDSDFQFSGFLGSDKFEVGAWEEKRLVSRDGQLELVAEIFLASIDQRSEKAAGGGACTVLAAVIANWLHHNPKILPLRCQFDQLIREGSSEWRNLCENKTHREKFCDQHFDLDTVLQAQVRPLSVISEKSYVGFFVLENMPDHLEFLQGAMTFDSIWEELQNNEAKAEEQIYIVSWNDHFFLLKIEAETIYIIDTLGERLFEGCNKAYILKFNKESRVYRVPEEPSNQKVNSEGSVENDSSSAGMEEDDRSNREIICEGKSSCKEFIKKFLAALPLRELQADIERGLIGEDPLHHLLQIEFQYTAPCNKNSQAYMHIKS